MVCAQAHFVDRREDLKAPRLADLVSGCSNSPNLEYFALHSSTATFPSPESTPFDSVDAIAAPLVPSGELPEVQSGATPLAASNALRAALETTLDRALISARRVAVLTGGGLDSGGLLALVDGWARRHGGSYFGLAVDFEGPGDDRPYLRALEQKLRCEVLRLEPEHGAEFASTISRGVDCAPMPWPSASFEWAAYVHAKRAGADCVVTGIGGDALFDGSPRSLAEYVRGGHPIEALQRCRRLRGFDRPKHPSLAWILRPLIAEALPHAVRARWARTAAVPIDEWLGPVARDFFEKERARRRRELKDRLVGRPSRLDAILARHRHQVASALGIRRIDPFVDPALQQFQRHLPRHFLLSGDVRRGLFREAIRDLVPAMLYQREDKASFEGALIRYVRAVGGFESFRGFARVPMLARFGLVDPARFLERFAALAQDPWHGRHWTRVWPILALEAFAQNHFGGAA